QFDKQVASRLPANADRSRLWLMPTTGTKLFVHRGGAWTPLYAELFSDEEKARILAAFDASLEATGFVPEEVWGDRIEDRGSQITFSALGVTREGVDKGYGLKKLSAESGIALGDMIFIGDAIFPGGNDYPAKLLGLDTVRVRDPRETIAVIETIVACLG
ncbi:MAG: HAD family hydrolase, partial [Sphingopyxis sp.]